MCQYYVAPNVLSIVLIDTVPARIDDWHVTTSGLETPDDELLAAAVEAGKRVEAAQAEGRRLVDEAVQARARALAAAHAAGFTWLQIGAALGVTRQRAQQAAAQVTIRAGRRAKH
jgi:hypothetical protein